MFNKKIIFLTALLIFICCIGAASAAEDINNDTLTTDSDVAVVEQADDSDDTALEVSNDEDVLSATGTATVSTWTDLKNKAETTGTDYTINLVDGVNYAPTSQIVFKNNAKIVGTSNSYISGTYNGIPFKNTNTALSITFKNVNFKDISCTMLMQMLTSGNAKTTLEGCTFTNVNASTTGQSSVIYNNRGTMDITDCTFNNCKGAYGVITNYMWGNPTGVILNVKNSNFNNNYANSEPGCINNCGVATVYNSTFIGNHANLWVGAIHTHTNANTLINKSTFKSNTAGWGGGALFTYSVLKVYDSSFEDNNCSGDYGGAIGTYNFGSQFDIVVDNCTFKKNNNLNSNGKGGAIGTLNGGYLNVYNSNFVDNYAPIGQAIAAANQYVENGTDDRPYLAIEGNNFINHTGSSDTVVITGTINSFKYNTFTNSVQNTHYAGWGNTYNSINYPVLNTNDLLGAFNDEILGDLERKVNDEESFYEAFSKGSVTRPDDEPQVIHVLISPGNYISAMFNEYDMGLLSLDWSDFKAMPQGDGAPETVYSYYNNVGSTLLSNAIFTVEGVGEVIFNPNKGYSLDLKGSNKYNDFGTESIYHNITYKNIIFDCDVDVGSRNFEFINCTFKKSLSINGWNIDDYWNYYYGENCNVVNNITFTDCTFDFNKEDVALNKAQDDHLQLRENSFNIKYINANFTDGIFNTADEVNSGDDETGNGTSTNSTDNATSGNGTSTNTGKATTNTNKQTTTAKVTKKATKITAKKATFKKSKKVKKYTITLKAGKAAVKKVKVTIKVGKKTYKATTNSKGKATFKITKLTKKGKYTAVIKFAGNKNFKPTSKKVKITVKK